MVEEVKRTFYTYRDLNASSIADIPATDLYSHIPRLKDGIKPWSRSLKRRWSEPQKYWLHRLVTEGIESGMYEYTMAANGQMSDWCAEPVLVQKDESDPWAEQRLTFNYSHVEEEMPGSQLPLLAEVHDDMADPRIATFCAFDLKHAYWTIPVAPDFRQVFAFNVPGFSQLRVRAHSLLDSP